MARFTVVALLFVATGIYADYAPTVRNPPEPKPKTGYNAPSSPNQYGEPSQGYYAPPSQGYYAQPSPGYYGQPTPAPTRPYYTTPKPTPPPPFVAPDVTYPKSTYQCSATCKPNSAKYMAYVCSSLYAKAVEWSDNKCKAYYDVASVYNTGSEYQARLCTYWTQKSVLSVVSSCFMEAHLRNEFIMKYGKDGPGIWYCRYSDFVNQVRDCYANSLSYYPLGKDLNNLETEVAALYTPDNTKMPPFEFRGASVAMCAYYNKDQVYNPVKYS